MDLEQEVAKLPAGSTLLGGQRKFLAAKYDLLPPAYSDQRGNRMQPPPGYHYIGQGRVERDPLAIVPGAEAPKPVEQPKFASLPGPPRVVTVRNDKYGDVYGKWSMYVQPGETVLHDPGAAGAREFPPGVQPSAGRLPPSE